MKFGHTEVSTLDIKHIISKSADEQTVSIYSEQILNSLIWTLIRCYLPIYFKMFYANLINIHFNKMCIEARVNI